MKEFYLDNMLLGIKPFSALHRFGVNGKVSGNLAAINEISGAVPVLYGPKGCGFHYRYSVRLRNKPYYDLECLNLQDMDVVFGAYDKLRKLILQIDKEQNPEIIFILPTVVSDIINDAYGIGEDLQAEVSAKIVTVKSQVFSHMDKSHSRKRLMEKVCQNGRCGSEVVYPGCGYVEIMDALVEQVMERQTVENNLINIESFIWGFGGTTTLARMISMLRQIGIEVNTLLPAANLQQIRRAPRAQLNIVRRKKWALSMREKFGTDFFHIADMQEWHGIEGICDFYRTIANKLGLIKEADGVLAAELNKIEKRYIGIKEEFSKYKFMLISNSFSTLPEQLSAYYKDYGFPINQICLILNPSFQQEAGVDSATMNKMHDRINLTMKMLGCEASLHINPSNEELHCAAAQSDVILCGSNPRYAAMGKPVLPLFLDHAVFDFRSFIEIMEAMLSKIKQTYIGNNLLLSRLEYDSLFFPMSIDDEDSHASREMFSRMWRKRK